MADLTGMLQAAAGAGGEYKISRSLRFNSADSAYLSRTPSSTSNQKTWTWSGWVKRSKLGETTRLFNALLGSGSRYTEIDFLSGDTIQIFSGLYTTGGSTTTSVQLITTQVFRDVSSWYHIVVAMDTTQATASNRTKLYVNGTQVTAFGTATYPSQNDNLFVNVASLVHEIGAQSGGTIFNGYLADINFIDGQALTPSSFGEINPDTGVWQPIKYAGSYGTNGFYLNFSDNSDVTASTLGKDYSGNGNNWTPNNFSVTAGAGNDSLVDSPTQYGTDTGAGGEVRGNYCTLNPLESTGVVLTNGNLDASYTTNAWKNAKATFSMPSGKWYFEFVHTTSVQFTIVGVFKTSTALSTATYFAASPDGWSYSAAYGELRNNDAFITSGISTATTGDIINVAVDIDSGKLWFGKNGTWFNSGNPATGANAAYTNLSGAMSIAVGVFNAGGNAVVSLNAGQRPFAYTAPSGFKALCTTNLPDPTVVQGDEYFNTVLYTGTGSSQNITGVGFQPDFVWIKERNAAADHALYDAVRGVQQQLESNTTTDETTESTGLTAFGTNGFTVGSLAQVNTSTDTYVAWNWKESTVSKFDIVTYTGNGTARTISHNLGVVPNMIIVKARTTASTDQGWPVYHSANTANPETDYLLLNDTAATADLDTVWNDTAPTSSVFSVGTNALVNANNDTYVAYLFANVAGYSAFGSYTGNASTDGPFVYTGFKPAWVLIKCSSTAPLGWFIFDSKRDTYNAVDLFLKPNTSEAESSTLDMDFTANGFKIRNTNGNINGNATTHIYAAFAENPFKFSLAR